MSDDLDALRTEVAEQHGLDTRAVKFLTGTNLPELEAQATDLAKLLGARPEPNQGEPPAGLFARKQRQEGALVAVLTGRTPPREPQTGRYATRQTGSRFDAGARTPPALPPPTHDQWLSSILSRHRNVGSW